MYVKFSFKENTHPRCMSLDLDYVLTQPATIVETLPNHQEVNKQVRVPIEPALDNMFGKLNACSYDFYIDCKTDDKALVNKTLEVFHFAFDGKLPMMDADLQYIEDGKNIIINAFKFCLRTIKQDQTIDKELLKEMIIDHIEKKMKQHESESWCKLFSLSLSDKSEETKKSNQPTVHKNDDNSPKPRR